MPLFYGNQRIKLNIGRHAVNLELYTSGTPITNNIRLLSSDDFCLKDSGGVYLTTKAGEK